MLKLLAKYEIFKAIHNFDGKSLDELTYRKDDIIIASPNAVEEWSVGFSGKVYGWFPVVTCSKIDIHNPLSRDKNIQPNRNDDMTDEEFDRHYMDIARSIFDEEKKYISEFVHDYKSIFKTIQDSNQIKDKSLVKLLDMSKRFILTYRKLITDLEDQLKKPVTEQLIGTSYIKHFNDIKKHLLVYCELHPFYVDKVLKIKPLLEKEFKKNNINVNIIKFFSKPFTRTSQFTLLLHECCYHTDFRYVDKDNFKVACVLFQLLSFCCDQIRNKSVEILEFTSCKLENCPKNMGKIHCMSQVFICEPNNRYERYLLLSNNYIILAIHLTNDSSPFKIDKCYEVSNLQIKSIADTDTIFNCLEIIQKNNTNTLFIEPYGKITAMFNGDTEKDGFLEIWDVVTTGNFYQPFWHKTDDNEKEDSKKNTLQPNTTPTNSNSRRDSLVQVDPKSHSEIMNYLKMINLKLNNMEKKYDTILREVQNLRIEINDFKLRN